MASGTPKRCAPAEGGQAIVEFLFTALTMMLVILGVLQMALILNAFSLVRYAAYNAARSGIVNGGDLEKMKEAARVSLLATFPSHGRADTARGFTENYLGAKAVDDNPILNDLGEAITKVEIVNKDALPCGQVVTFDDPVDTPDASLTVKVTHSYEMVVPFVNRLLYYVYRQVLGGGYENEDIFQISAKTDQLRRSGAFRDIEYRIRLIGVYTMRLQSDFANPDC